MDVSKTMNIGDTVLARFDKSNSKLIIWKEASGVITHLPLDDEKFVMLDGIKGFKKDCHDFFVTRVVLIEKTIWKD
jgi:hypothetical protein